MSRIGNPVTTLLSYLATFGLDHVNTIPNLVFDPLEHANAAAGIIAVPAEMDLRGIWTNHGD